MTAPSVNDVTRVREHALEGIGQPTQIMSLSMIVVIVSDDGRVPSGQKNLTKPDRI
jgi:hypothetical protein